MIIIVNDGGGHSVAEQKIRLLYIFFLTIFIFSLFFFSADIFKNDFIHSVAPIKISCTLSLFLHALDRKAAFFWLSFSVPVFHSVELLRLTPKKKYFSYLRKKKWMRSEQEWNKRSTYVNPFSGAHSWPQCSWSCLYKKMLYTSMLFHHHHHHKKNGHIKRVKLSFFSQVGKWNKFFVSA